ncbi:hypothetical protein BVK86_21090 [Pseudomonas reinekei]|uniref:Uncharacterized protein n=1 Tax=Pseudomonas reinekei TaxID=395598 RepID=A0A1Q9WPL3_PSERE|nr:hypothetical protein BVK86_21090 [Pseudomonas reinekei]
MTVFLGFISLFLIFSMFLVLVWIFLFSSRYTEIVEGYLDKSKFVVNNREAFSGLGLIGSAMRNGSIALMFLCPRVFERRGLIEKDELLNLPLDLKRKLIAPWIVGGVVFFAMLVIRIFFV